MYSPRRNFLRGRFSACHQNVILPWLTSSKSFYERCSRCMQCQLSCPENIIVADDYAYPTIDFKRGECVFCAECAKACPESLFVTDKNSKAWNYIAHFGSACLTLQGVSCQSCQDSCESRAIRFSFQLGITAQPNLLADNCTGCGACVSVCPTYAISVKPAVQSSTKEEILNVT